MNVYVQSHQNPCFKILMPTAMVLGGGSFGGKLGYESRILTIRVSTLIDRRGPRENTHHFYHVSDKMSDLEDSPHPTMLTLSSQISKFQNCTK